MKHAAEPVLRASSVQVTRAGRTLLRHVDLQLFAGQVLGLLGPSGAGKSTLFRYLSGTITGRGEVHLGGTRIARWPLWRRAQRGLGVMPQEPSVLLDLSVAENLHAFGVHAAQIATCAARVQLDTRLSVRASELSAGERRRLEFLRATSSAPKVLLCDEPFAGVDPQGAARLGQLLREQAAQGCAVLLADHHVEQALAICDQALLLLEGEIAVPTCTIHEFTAHPLACARYLRAQTP